MDNKIKILSLNGVKEHELEIVTDGKSNRLDLHLKVYDREMFEFFINKKFSKYDGSNKKFKLPVGLYMIPFFDKHFNINISNLFIDKSKSINVNNIKDTFGKFKLRNFQKEFLYKIIKLYNITTNISSGFLLSDEMGTGKTVQSTSFILNMLDNTPEDIFRVIIVTPLSVKFGFEETLREMNEDKYPIIMDIKKEDNFNLIKQYNKCIVLTHYDELKGILIDNKKYKELVKIFKTGNNIMVVDEVTYLKNKGKSKTHITNLFKKFRMSLNKQLFVLGLSGTPLEKSLEDFFNIIDFIYPNYIGKDFFNKYFTVWKEQRIRGGRTITIPSHYINLTKFNELITPIYLRRLKQDVSQELGDKIERYIEVETDEYQLLILEEVLDQLEIKYDKEMIPFISNVYFREILDDPRVLFINDNKDEDELTIDNKLLTPYDKDYIPPKMKELLNILKDTNEQFILFTFYERVGNNIKDFLNKNGYNVEIVSGRDSLKKRKEKIEKLKNGEYKGLITTDALSYGVNLQFVNILINYEIPYNLGKFKQRIDRIHRIGNDNNKLIINLYSTLEEKIVNKIRDRIEDFIKSVEGKEELDENDEMKVIKDTDMVKILLKQIKSNRKKRKKMNVK